VLSIKLPSYRHPQRIEMHTTRTFLAWRASHPFSHAPPTYSLISILPNTSLSLYTGMTCRSRLPRGQVRPASLVQSPRCPCLWRRRALPAYNGAMAAAAPRMTCQAAERPQSTCANQLAVASAGCVCACVCAFACVCVCVCMLGVGSEGMLPLPTNPSFIYRPGGQLPNSTIIHKRLVIYLSLPGGLVQV